MKLTSLYNPLPAICILALLAAPLTAQVTTAEQEALAAEQSPTVQALLESDPETAAELVRTILALVDFDRHRLARPFFGQLTRLRLSENQMAELVREVGSHTMIRFSNMEQFKPLCQHFADKVMAAADKRTRDPARLARLVQQLTDPSPEVRYAAVVDLKMAKTTAVTTLLSALAKSSRPAEREAIKDALAEMSRLAVPPLMGALESRDEAFLAEVIDVLGRLDIARAGVYMARPAILGESPRLRAVANETLLLLVGATPQRSSAARAIENRAQRYLQGVRPFQPDHEGLVEVWNWDDAKKQSSMGKFAADDVGMILAARLTRDLHALKPDKRSYLLLYLATQLESAKILYGFDQPLPAGPGTVFATAASHGPQVIEELLDYSLERELTGAATAAAEILGKQGGESLLRSRGNRLAPLVRAVDHANRRLRFAALAAIMQIDPVQPYRGASHVSEALGFFISTAGSRRALVAHHRAAEAQNLVGLLGQLGYEADVAYNGRALLHLAATAPDVDLILIETSIDRPPLREVLYRLRRNKRTGRVPVGLVSGVDDLPDAKQLATEHPLMRAFPRPHNLAALQGQVDRLNKRARRGLVSVGERNRQAALALAWLERLSARKTYYDVLRQAPAVETALTVPGLTKPASAVLVNFGTPSGQRALVDLASQRSFPIGDRQTAAAAFRQSAQRHGVLLTGPEILHQYDLYNGSEFAGRPTQQVLSSILDTIEAPSKKTNDAGEQP